MKSILFFIIFVELIYLDVYPQEGLDQLTITEVNLNERNQENWIEVFNPTKNEITLESFRISGVRTLNILPPQIRRQGGIELKPGEYLIICSDSKKFSSKYNKILKTVEVKLLTEIEEGGFLAINLDSAENSFNIIRYGNKEKSNELKDLVKDEDVLSFSKDELSYSRKINDKREISNWFKTIPSPGEYGGDENVE